MDEYDEFGNRIDESDYSDGASAEEVGTGPTGTGTGASGAGAGTEVGTGETSEDEPEDEPEDEEEADGRQVAIGSTDLALGPGVGAFGPGVETIIAQPVAAGPSEPVIAPASTTGGTAGDQARSIGAGASDAGSTASAMDQYMIATGKIPGRLRNVAVVGSLHSGKTIFLDMFIRHSPRCLDTHVMEVTRQMTIKSSPVTMLLDPSDGASSYGRASSHGSYGSLVVTAVDTPGHPNFQAEAVAALHAAESVVLVLDAVEGFTGRDQALVDLAVALDRPIVVVINKLDRLVLELKLPPVDCYYKLEYMVGEVNEAVARASTSVARAGPSVPRAGPKVEGPSASVASARSARGHGPTSAQRGSTSAPRHGPIGPQHNNVMFASAKFGFCFNLKTWGDLYEARDEALAESQAHMDLELALASSHLDVGLAHSALDSSLRDSSRASSFTRRLWGNNYYDPSTHKLTSTASPAVARTFVHFILEPLYKLFTYTLTRDRSLSGLLKENFGVKLSRAELEGDALAVLGRVLGRVVGTGGFVDVVRTMPAPAGALDEALAESRAEGTGPGPSSGPAGASPGTSSSSTPRASAGSALGQVLKLLNHNGTLLSMVRVHKPLHVGQTVKILGPNYAHDDQDFALAPVQGLYVPCGAYHVAVEEVSPGSIVLARGLEMFQRAYLVPAPAESSDEAGAELGPAGLELGPAPAHLALDSAQASSRVFKVAVEPKHPAQLPLLVKALKTVSMTYPDSIVKVEEEHVIYGTGEVMMDCFLHDVREFVEIRVSGPMVRYGETVGGRSVVKVSTSSSGAGTGAGRGPSSGPNSSANGPSSGPSTGSISIIAEPIQNPALSTAIASGHVTTATPPKVLRKHYGMDPVESESVWGFSTELDQASILLDDRLSHLTSHGDSRGEGQGEMDLGHGQGEVDLAGFAQSSALAGILLGFQWACNEGPLVHSPIRATKFRVLDLDLTGLSPAQLIPMVRRACYTGFMTAGPRLMEPYYQVSVTCTARAQLVLGRLLAPRRGQVTATRPIPGTALCVVEGTVPVIESIGLETDLRLQTQGQAMCYLTFWRYQVVPGNPLDGEVYLPELKPVPEESLARDMVMKTRRRGGGGEPSLERYVGGEVYQKLQRLGLGTEGGWS